jgi:hypothetical protein
MSHPNKAIHFSMQNNADDGVTEITGESDARHSEKSVHGTILILGAEVSHASPGI